MHFDWTHSEFDKTCPVCAKDGRKSAILTADHVLPGHPRVTLLRCFGCGAAFLSNLTPPAYEHELSGLTDYYIEQGGGVDLMVAPLLRLPRDSVRRCLEIGCGFGFALDFCRHAFGWEILGVDPSSLAASGAAMLKLPIVPAYFDATLDLGADPFDLVLCSEILEHVAEPHSLLSAIRKCLSPDGLLVLSTPNLAIVKEGSDAGALGRALSPGLHLVLYDRGSLAIVLAEAGFSEVIIEESPDTLHAFAASSRAALEWPRPPSREVQQALLRDYFSARADSAAPASAAASGFAYRHFKECVNAGLYAEAVTSRERLARVYRDRHGLELEKPDQLEVNPLQRFPFNLTGALSFSGILELNSLNRPDRAAAYFSAAVKVGRLLLREQNPWGLYDGETEALLRESRKLLPIALASSQPDHAVVALEALESTNHDCDALSPAMIAEARAQTFVRLVNAGAYDAADRIAPQLSRQIDLESLEENGELTPGALDAPFCLAMLALQQSRYSDAASLFGRVFRAAGRRVWPARAEILWSSRVHEALSLSLAGRYEAARATLEEMDSAAGQPEMPLVPPHLIEAARQLFLRGGYDASAPPSFTPRAPAPRLLIAERFVASCARLSGVELPLDVIACQPLGRLRLALIGEGEEARSHRVSTITPERLSADESLQLAFAPFANDEGATFIIGALLVPCDDAAPVDDDLDTIRAAASDRSPIVLTCRNDDDAGANATLLVDESSIATFRVGRRTREGFRIAHAIEVYWCDPHGIYIGGWAHAWDRPVRAIRLESAGRSARIDTLDERADLLVHYPEHDHVRKSGFALYLACAAGSPVTLVLETDRGDASIPLQLPAGPVPAWAPDEISDGELTPGLRRFAELANARNGVIMQIGSRTAPGAEASPPRRLFQRRVIGIDIHPGRYVDVVGDAHNLSSFVREGSVDAILSLSVLEHLEAPWLLAGQINRILKPGGLVYHQAPAAWPAHAQPNDFWRMSSEGLRVLFGARYGFEVIEARDFGPAAIVPGPGWRNEFMGMPTVPAYASSEIVSRKVAELDSHPDSTASRWRTSEDRSREYPVSGLRLPERGGPR